MSILRYFKKISTAKEMDKTNQTAGQAENIAAEDSDKTIQEQSQVSVCKICEKRKLQSLSTSRQKRRKWIEDYDKYGIFLPKKEEDNSFPTAQCLFCSVKYANSNLVPSKLFLHLKNKHPEHEHKSEIFFQSKVAEYLK